MTEVIGAVEKKKKLSSPAAILTLCSHYGDMRVWAIDPVACFCGFEFIPLFTNA